MDQASSTIAAAAVSDKAPRASKGKPAAKQAPARQVATQAQRIVITFNTAARECPDATQVANITRAFGLIEVDYHAICEATEEQIARSAKTLTDNLSEKAIETRHVTWFTDEVETLLSHFRVARVAADPACVPRAAAPGGWPGSMYHRLHGSPKVYYSAYKTEYIADLGARIAAVTASAEVWCIFDNTARGEATNDACSLQQRRM